MRLQTIDGRTTVSRQRQKRSPQPRGLQLYASGQDARPETQEGPPHRYFWATYDGAAAHFCWPEPERVAVMKNTPNPRYLRLRMARLRHNSRAITWLHQLGVDDSTIEHFGLG